MTKVVNFCKSTVADVLADRMLMHPVLLVATFLTAKYAAFWLMTDVIMGTSYDYGFFGLIFLYLMFSFVSGAYFLVFCFYLLFATSFSRKFRLLWLVFAALILAGCVWGYIGADINRQKEGVIVGFLIASLVAICIYILAAVFATKSFLLLAYAIIYLISFAGAVWLIYMADYLLFALETLCPLAWAFYFRSEFNHQP